MTDSNPFDGGSQLKYFQRRFGDEMGAQLLAKSDSAVNEFDLKYQQQKAEFEQNLVKPGERFTFDGKTYQVGKKLGEGGFSAVYYVQDEDSGEKRVVKAPLPTILNFIDYEKTKKGLEKEAGMIKQVKGPGVVRQYNLVDLNDVLYLMLEYLPQGINGLIQHYSTLGEKNKEFGAFLAVAKNLSLAMGRMDEEDIIHFDIKPGNVRADAKHQPKLLDFGSAYQVDGYHRSQPGVTDHYLAPELLVLRKQIANHLSSGQSLDDRTMQALTSAFLSEQASAQGIGREVDVCSFGYTLAQVGAVATVADLGSMYNDQAYSSASLKQKRNDFHALLARRSFNLDKSKRIDEKKFLKELADLWFMNEDVIKFIAPLIDPIPENRPKHSELVTHVENLEAALL